MNPHEETYQRGDLSGIVIDMGDDMVRVRFLDSSDHRGKTVACRMVVRMDGSLGIDPSGLPMRRPPSQLELEEQTATDADSEDITDVEELPSPPKQLPDVTMPAKGSSLEVQVRDDNNTIYVGTVVEADFHRVKIEFPIGQGIAYDWRWGVAMRPRIICQDWSISVSEEAPE